MIDVAQIDASRTREGFLTIDETVGLSAIGVVIVDPFSTLVSVGVDVSPGVVLWPGVILQAGGGGRITVGESTRLYPGTRIVAVGGRVTIGKEVELGEEGGFTVKADRNDIVIEIGDGARLLGGGSLSLNNTIGHGAQVLGPIRLQSCSLASGGTHQEPDPDRRGAVLKGSGVARGIEVPTGMVIQAFGLFSDAPVRKQSYFHPKPAR